MLTTNQKLIQFIDASPTSFHAVDNMKNMLLRENFIELEENQSWQLISGNNYYVSRNQSAIIAFKYIDNFSAIKIAGAHTDSPCLKIKPQPDIYINNYFQLQTEVYGSPLLNTWFDRDLSIAGRVYYLDQQDKICNTLINLSTPIAVIPSLAIHLDPTANNNRTINLQTGVNPILALATNNNNNESIISIIEATLVDKNIKNCQTILDFDLSLYDTNNAKIIGTKQQFISSSRLDNLLSCFLGAQALIASKVNNSIPLLVCNDHEEVGSESNIGAQGSFLKDILNRICKTTEKLAITMSNSMLVSTDNAHGIHPNYPDKHDKNHAPLLNKGVVIKVNNNQSYATNAETAAIFKNICRLTNSDYQVFASRSDIRCGTTIGPLTSSLLGIKTIDIGIPTFAMHSIRELAGTEDNESMLNILRHFFNE